MQSKGSVVAVSTRADSGVPKHPQAQVYVGAHGVEGDFHAGTVNKHKKKGPPEPNHRQITVVAREALERVNAELGTDLGPGSIGENVLVQGLGDLSHLAVGERLKVGREVTIEVTGQNSPCATLQVYHQDIVKALAGRRGITATVVKTGAVRPGDAVRVLRQKKAASVVLLTLL